MADYTFDRGIYIDGVYYDVPIVSVKRTANKIWKYADRTEEGIHVGEILGIYYNFTIKIGDIHDTDEYDRFFSDITSSRAYRTVKMPSAEGGRDFTFTCYLDKVSDEIAKSKKGKNIKKGLSFQMIAKEPARR